MTTTKTIYTYSINCTDTDAPTAWHDTPGIVSATSGNQDSGRCRWTVVTTDPAALEASLEADDAVLTYDHLSKEDIVARWDSVASYVATYPDTDGEGACDVDVQVGKGLDGRWYLRTRDDAGGSDDAGDGSYATEEEAVASAQAMADERTEARPGEDAADFLARQAPRIGLSFERGVVDEHGNVNYDVTMTINGRVVAGQTTYYHDRINGGGLAPVGDSLDCWISHSLQMELASLPGGTDGRLGRALIGALATRDAGEVRP